METQAASRSTGFPAHSPRVEPRHRMHTLDLPWLESRCPCASLTFLLQMESAVVAGPREGTLELPAHLPGPHVVRPVDFGPAAQLLWGTAEVHLVGECLALPDTGEVTAPVVVAEVGDDAGQ